MEKKTKYLIIVNPNAGKKKARNDWPEIANLFDSAGIEYEYIFTKYGRQAIKLVKEKIEEEGFMRIVAIGGDGTINEVVNGILLQKRFNSNEISLGIITIGTGNDWGKMFNLPLSYKESVDIIKRGNIFVQDVGKVYYYIGEKKSCRYFVNAAGLGFDALVTENTNKQKEAGKSSTLSYFTNMIKSLYRYKPVPVTVLTTKREIHSGNLFTLSLAIGKYTGGGMQQTPNAISDDGLFDLMLVDKIAKTKLIRKVSKLFNGRINELKEVQSLRTDNLQVVSDSKLMIEVDGENIGHAPFEFELVPRSLKVYIP